MISYRRREGKRGRSFKMTRNIERLYKEGKCRECSVVVTRMDFAKILGKFTKVKIQYESSSSPKVQKTPPTNKTVTPVLNTRLKSNENGMVQFHRKAYNPHPAKDLIKTRRNANINKVASPLTRQASTNILKEINVLKDTNSVQNKSINYHNINSNGKQYAIIFNDPTCKHNNNSINNCEFTLLDLLPKVNNGILPSEEWCIDYFPKTDEPKNDKVYDRIAAELEDLMYNEKPIDKSHKYEVSENKVDEFPSIMDILNDNTPENNSEPKDQNNSLEFKDNLESNDVEAMLLGKTDSNKMSVDNTEVNKLIADVVQFSSNTESATNLQNTTDFDNPHSPSILDETLQKGIEEHLPNPQLQSKFTSENSNSIEKNNKDNTNNQNCDEIITKNGIQSNVNFHSSLKLEDATHVIFKKVVDGKCIKSVTCPRNLKYSIELEDKSVEFLGAPKYISNLDDLQVLLQIVNETNLTSLYVLY
ncbi:beclin-1-like protein A [Maniola hyperantus]|uniref:beclin-1-like protein A n=1 Tax=Aphantopus hyperantus TaxID=2795564 RepID=UPI001569CAEC|nr:ribosomal protein VAR1, mitochondrial-like [Maniola hyperantus]